MYGITVSRFTYYPPHVITTEHHIAYSHLGNKEGPFPCDALSPPPVPGCPPFTCRCLLTLWPSNEDVEAQGIHGHGLPAPDLGSMLNPIRAFNFAPEPTFKGITTLHISILVINRDVRGPDI